ncbi:MAG: lipocalin-like domain-containing protein [Bryobacteraceae bacterium]
MKACALTLLFLLLVACGGGSAPQTAATPAPEPAEQSLPAAATDRNSLNGVWQLVSFDQTESDGNVSHPYGEMPLGRLTLDAAGRMSVFVMKPGRFASVNSTAAITTATVDDLRQIADGFIAYYGAFQVDDSTKTIITRVEAATIPAWTDSEQKRAYELDGDTLALITPATKLTWKRLPN